MTATITELSTLPRTDAPTGAFSILEAIEAQAASRPWATAVTGNEGVMTYVQLNRQACRLAQRLRRMGVGRDVPVGLCLPRTPGMVMAAFAVLKSGSAYMPLDPNDPPDRLAFILKDAGAPVLVTDSATARSVAFPRERTVLLDSIDLTAEKEDEIGADIRSTDLAYVIYTSGSTGRPKGVELTHEGLANLVSWHREAFSVTPKDRASHVAGLSFDASVWEIWPYLAAGARLHLIDDASRTSPEMLRDWLVEYEITIGFVPTPIAERMFFLDWPENTPLRLLLTGGDRLRRYPPPSLSFRVVNNYGPTEGTVVATSGEVPTENPGSVGAGRLPSIGKAIANTWIYLLDSEGQPVSAEGSGEICISGPGVARGYRNQPELTREKFVPDTFHEQPGRLMYRTGDLGRARADGEIEFVGRLDDQIKIRGYRIEPGDVIATLNRHALISESLVMGQRDASGEMRLVCYVVLHTNATVTSTELRRFLGKSLPEYMIPSLFVPVDSFPMTSHGKVDRQALPRPDAANILPDEPQGERLLTDTERRVGTIAAHLLTRESIGVDDNFFLLGGHSLLGAQLIHQLRGAFGIEIPLRTLFGAPTTAQLAREIETRLNTGSSQIA